MNESCLPFRWPCDSHTHAHLAECFHGSSGVWNTVLVVKAEMGALGDVWLSQDPSSALWIFFCPWPQSWEHVPHCSGCWEAFLKTAASLNAKVYEERGGKVVGNLAWSSELHCQGPPPTTSELALLWPLNGTMLPSAGTCGPNMQTQTLTYDATLECCCDVFKVVLRGELSILCCAVQHKNKSSWNKYSDPSHSKNKPPLSPFVSP